MNWCLNGKIKYVVFCVFKCSQAIFLLRGVSLLTQRYLNQSRLQPRLTKSSNSSPVKHRANSGPQLVMSRSANRSNRISCVYPNEQPYDHPAFTLPVDPTELLGNEWKRKSSEASSKKASSFQDVAAESGDLVTPTDGNSRRIQTANGGVSLLAREETIVCSPCPCTLLNYNDVLVVIS
ncbi:hypothetical protein Ciccas_005342 [Cichlidogyrus casuarinus]|uniref:Uncharacterized protein n=1 Tax=Cichlidogyrus casuarinus TaxID=1844966 RepID=A0ABD2Q8Y1_9PLAT